ncbi:MULTISPECIES: hypothetical protein [unclassified Bartonella]|uniref:hypothetical protein n=1 Tax=unclassified Bartonella TaxID=2645622 RepID=UPI0035D0BA1D
MIKKKYELTDETIKVDRITLYCIHALKDFGDVKKGDLGGFIENENNLSYDGNCWIGDYACVYDDAKVYENAQVSGGAFISGNAKIYDSPLISIREKVGGNAKIYGYAFIHGNAEIINDETITTGERQ